MARREGDEHARSVSGLNHEVIYVDRTDDIDTILERLEWVRGRHALIVVPGSWDILANLVYLKLLKRRAEALQLDVLLVARDGMTRTLAKQLGIRAFATQRGGLGALRRLQKRDGRLREEVATPELVELPPPLEQPAKGRVKPRRKPGDRFRLRTLPSRGKVLSYLATFLILLASAAGLAYTIVTLVPLATVSVVPATSRISETVMVTADPNASSIDFAKRIIPGRVIEVRVEGSAEIPTVNKRDAPNQRATGRVIFTNRTNQEVTVPLGTVVRTSTGVNIRFTTVQTTTVPAGIGNRAEADIVAVTPGPSGNVGAFLINVVEGSTGLSVSVINERPTSGGDVKQVGVVTAADKERLKAILLQRLRQEALARIREQLDAQEFVPPETLQAFVVSELYDKFVDELADSLGLKMQIVANAVAIAGHDANDVALDALQAAVPSDYYLAAQGLTFERGEVRQIDERRRISFPMTASGIIVAKLDTTGLREALQGQPIPRAEAIVRERLPLRKPPKIEVRPNWFNRMPELPFRIHIVIVTELD